MKGERERGGRDGEQGGEGRRGQGWGGEGGSEGGARVNLGCPHSLFTRAPPSLRPLPPSLAPIPSSLPPEPRGPCLPPVLPHCLLYF